jgi:hypothetical protein
MPLLPILTFLKILALHFPRTLPLTPSMTSCEAVLIWVIIIAVLRPQGSLLTYRGNNLMLVFSCPA